MGEILRQEEEERRQLLRKEEEKKINLFRREELKGEFEENLKTD